ncbi:MAG TPA: hypothetical protein PLO23_09725 [Alphaproteobacteria bacterium]|nr:hypothetical protein [Alphaproteobacteria bacterium]
MSSKAAKPSFLKLVDSFSERTFRYKYTIQLSYDLEPDAHLDVAYLSALRFYIHQKTQEMGIEDYRVFVEDEHMDLHFLCADDRQKFEEAYEERAHQAMTILLKPAENQFRFQLENMARSLNGLAHQFELSRDIHFSATNDGIEMESYGRDAFVMFFQEYAYVKDRMDFQQMLGAQAVPPAPV